MNKISKKLLTIVLSLLLVFQMLTIPVFAYDKDFEDNILDLGILVNEDFESENSKSPLSIDASPWGPTGIITLSPDGNGKALMLDKTNTSPFKMPITSDARSATLAYDIYIPAATTPTIGFIRTQIAGSYCVMAQVDASGILKVNNTDFTYEITRDAWHRLSFTIDYNGLRAIVYAAESGEELQYIGETSLTKGSSGAGIGRFQQQTLKDGAMYFDNYYFTTYADLYVAVNNCETAADIGNVIEFYEQNGIFNSDADIDRTESKEVVYEALTGKNFKSNEEFMLAYEEAVGNNYTGIIVDYDTISLEDKVVSLRFANASDNEEVFRVHHIAYSVFNGYNILVESSAKEFTLPAFNGENTEYEISKYTFTKTDDLKNITYKTIITNKDNRPVKCITYGDDTVIYEGDISDSLDLESYLDTGSGMFTVEVKGAKANSMVFVSALDGRYIDSSPANESGCAKFVFKTNMVLNSGDNCDTFVVDASGAEKHIEKTYETNKVAPVIDSVSVDGKSNIGGYLEVEYDGYFQLGGIEEDENEVCCRWYVADSEDGVPVLIEGAENKRFDIDDDKYGEKFILASVMVVSKEGVVSEEYFSAPSPVMLAPKANNVKVTGAAVEGNILSASYEYYHATNPESGSVIRWIALDSDGKEAEELATGSLEYKIRHEDIGKTIAFSITPCTNAEPSQGRTVVEKAGTVVKVSSSTKAPYAEDVIIADSYERNVLSPSYKYIQDANVAMGESVVEWYVSDENGENYELVLTGDEFEFDDEYSGRFVKYAVSPVSQNQIRGERVFSNSVKMYSVPVVSELNIKGRVANGQKVTAEYKFSDSLSDYDNSIITWYINGISSGNQKSFTIAEDCRGGEIKLVVTPVSGVFPHKGEDAVVTMPVDDVEYAPAVDSEYITTEILAPAAKYASGNMTTYKDTSPFTDYGENTYITINPANSNPWISGFEADGIIIIDMRVYLTAVEGRTSKSGEQIRVRYSNGVWSDFFTTIKSGKFNGNDEVVLNENQWYNLRFVLDNDDNKLSIYYGSDENHLEKIALSEGYDKYAPGHKISANYLQFAAVNTNAGASNFWNFNSLKVSSIPPAYETLKNARNIKELEEIMDEYKRYSLFDYPVNFDTADDKTLILEKILERVSLFESTNELEQYFAGLCDLHQNGAIVTSCKIYDGSADVSDAELTGIGSVKSVTEIKNTDSSAKTRYVITALYENNANGDKTLCKSDVKEVLIPADGSVSVSGAVLTTDVHKNYAVSVFVWDKQYNPGIMLSVKSFNDKTVKSESGLQDAPANGISINTCTVNPVTGQVITQGNCVGGDGQYISFEVINPSGERVYVDELYSAGADGSFYNSFTLASPSVSGEYKVNVKLNKSDSGDTAAFALDNAGNVEPAVRRLQISGDNYLKQTVFADYEYYQVGGVPEKESEYRWYISSDKDGEYSLIEGEKTSELNLSDVYQGKYIKVEVTPVSSAGVKGSGQYSEPVRVLVAPSVNSVKISGKVQVGNTVSVTYRFIEPLYGLEECGTKYEWYVGSVLVGTEQSYKIKSSDSGKYIKCVVTPGISAYPYYGDAVSTPSERVGSSDDSGKSSGGGGGGGGGSVPSAVIPYTPVPGLSVPDAGSVNQTLPFEDTNNHWALESIANLYAKGIVKGVDQSHYNPDGTVTRAEFAALINRIINSSTKGDISFDDVNENAWYYDDVCRIVSSGIMQGDSGSFRPDDNITREEMALVARRVYTYKFNTVPNVTKTDGFTDYADISVWAYDAVMYCQNAGIVIGDQSGNFNPKNHMTRAEATVIIERLMNLK